MLKKAGIVVAAIAAATLAMSPLAFAGGKDHEKSDKDHSKSDHDKKDKDKKDKDDDDKDKDKDKDHDKDKDKDKDHDKDKDKDKHHDKDKDKDKDWDKDEEPEPVVTETNNEDNLSTSCTFDQTQQVDDSTVGGAGVLGAINLALDVIVPVAAQAPILSCNTVGVTDAVDVNSENNTESVDRTRVANSFNEG